MAHDKRNQRVTGHGTGNGAFRIADRMPDGIDSLLQGILDYFLAHLRESGAVIRKAQIDPLAFHKALPKVWIYERIAKHDFVCRLAGDDVRSMYARPIVGCSLLDLIRVQHAPDVMAHHEAILATPGVGYMTGRVYLQSLERYGIGERLLLPALDEEGRPSFIWGATSYNIAEMDDRSDVTGPNRLLIPLTAFSAESC
ncbi:MAG: PAS domain-containing protein [Oceanibaculum nanhaiense]|jgi:hypothetical protein|uniref:PAS domain-containing protein n=1 Tax=Oceanibaculum nanhaiense TaxID=1909734 RepID=UPI0032EC9B55